MRFFVEWLAQFLGVAVGLSLAFAFYLLPSIIVHFRKTSHAFLIVC